MKVTITSIALKSPLKFFALSQNALYILRQLKTTDCVKMKKKGFWMKHYTMTLWKSEQELKDFAKSGAHLKAMQSAKDIASEIRTLTIDAEDLPDWKTAMAMLDSAHCIRY